MIKSTSVKELKEWLQSGEAVLIDVREPKEYVEGHIEGSTLIPLGEISTKKLPPHQGKKLVMQCRLGGRSLAACTKLNEGLPGYDVYNLDGGFEAWKNAGYNVQK